MIEINGSYFEGGGQIVRTSLALSTVTGKSVKIYDIRKGREKPGLKPQHIACIKALEQLCNAQVKGVYEGSEELEFIPGKIQSKKLELDIGTAGSITLVLQSLLFPCMFSDKKIELIIKGGTDTKWSIPYDYFAQVLIPYIQKFCHVESSLLSRGYYPRGQGSASLVFRPKYKLKDFDNFDDLVSEIKKVDENRLMKVSRGKLLVIKGISHASSNLEGSKVAERQADSAKSFLKSSDVPISIQSQYYKTESPGSGLVLWALFSDNKDSSEMNAENPIIIGADSLGDKNRSSETIGIETAKKLKIAIDSGCSVDAYLADNLVPFMIFGGKINCQEITNHCKANVYVVNSFFPGRIRIENNIITSD